MQGKNNSRHRTNEWKTEEQSRSSTFFVARSSQEAEKQQGIYHHQRLDKRGWRKTEGQALDQPCFPFLYAHLGILLASRRRWLTEG